METLRELTQQYLEVLDMMQDPEVDQQTVADTLEAIDGDIEAKADAYAEIRETLKAKAKRLEDESKRLKEWSESIKKNVKRLETNLGASMITLGKLKFETDHHKFNYRKAGGALPLLYPNIAGEPKAKDVPEEYRREKIEMVIDTDKIRKALAEGQELEFVRLGERTRYLDIK